MNYRLLAFDLDDTLLNDELKISERNKAAIREAARKNLIITIATGRMYCSSLPYVKDLKLDTDWPMINYHGALVKTTESGQVLYHRPVEHELALSILDKAENTGMHVNVFINDRIYISEENSYSRYYQSIANVEAEPVGLLADFLRKTGESPTKLTIINWDGKLDAFEAEIKRQYGNRLTTMQSRRYFLEVTDYRSTKGQALKMLAEKYNIRPEEIIAFGDSMNDIDMLQYAGLGVAVANARPEVRAIADVVTASNVEDGVAKVLEEYVL